MFAINHRIATYCPIRGGVNGARTVRLPATYETRRLALKLASVKSAAAFENCSDDYYVAVDAATGHPINVPCSPAIDDDEMPF